MPTGDAALAAQKPPALHGFAVAVVLPGAVQEPASHVPLHVDDVSPAPPPYRPAAQSVGAAAPAAQKAPAGHCT